MPSRLILCVSERQDSVQPNSTMLALIRYKYTPSYSVWRI